MPDDLTIYFNPLGGQAGSPLERACYADIGLALGEQWLTLLEDRMARTVSNYLRGSVHQLATWFAANWWRLRWEPEIRDWTTNVDWRMTHSVASAGGGFVWPNVLFASDGNTIAVASRPSSTAAAFEPIRYLNTFDGRITVTEFESKVDLFMESVITRIRNLDIANDGLLNLWAEVMSERRDPNTANWRKLEAMAGYDPDEAPNGLISKLRRDQEQLGISAVEELAAEARHNVDEVLQPMRNVSRSQKPKEGGYRVSIPHLEGREADDLSLPWQNAAKLAAQARKEWDLGSKPILNKRLAGLLATKGDVFSSSSAPLSKTPFAIRKGRNGTIDVYLQSPIAASRRFALCRLIGDHLSFTQREKLLPATHTKTVRQKFQRAFAQEFLCPYSALVDKVQTEEPNEDDIAEAAAHFHVSPLLVKTTLVNKGDLERVALAANHPSLALAV